MDIDSDERTAEQKAAGFAAHIEEFIRSGRGGLRGKLHGEITMTDATEAIWGTSGRGNLTAVQIIEATAVMGYLRIRQAGRRKRLVSRTDKPIPGAILAYHGISKE